MSERWQARRVIILTCCLLGFWAACDGDTTSTYRIVEYSGPAMAQIDQGRPLLDQALVVKGPEVTELTVGNGSVSYPAAVAIAEHPICKIAVASFSDGGVVHFFDHTGRYIKSVSGGASDTSYTRDVISVAMNARGDVALFSFAKQLYTLLDSLDNRLWSVRPQSDFSNYVASEIALSDSRVIFDNWSRSDRIVYPTAEVKWESNLPLVRVITESGVVDTYGHMDMYPSGIFGPVMNRGRISLAGDTLWFAALIDARLRALADVHTKDRFATTVKEFPVFFHTGRPVAAVFGDRIQTAAEHHLSDFIVTTSGLTIVSQSQPYELAHRVEDRNYVPHSALVIYDNNGDAITALDFDSYIPHVAATDEVAVIIYQPLGAEDYHVGMFRLPEALAPSEYNSCLR